MKKTRAHRLRPGRTRRQQRPWSRFSSGSNGLWPETWSHIMHLRPDSLGLQISEGTKAKKDLKTNVQTLTNQRLSRITAWISCTWLFRKRGPVFKPAYLEYLSDYSENFKNFAVKASMAPSSIKPIPEMNRTTSRRTCPGIPCGFFQALPRHLQTAPQESYSAHMSLWQELRPYTLTTVIGKNEGQIRRKKQIQIKDKIWKDIFGSRKKRIVDLSIRFWAWSKGNWRSILQADHA